MNYHYITVHRPLYAYSYELSVQQYNDLLPGMLYVLGTGMVFTAVITSKNFDSCCCFAATAADAGDGALYWCCSMFTVAAPAAPAAALYC